MSVALGSPPAEARIDPSDEPRSRLSVTLRVAGDVLDPAEISRVLGVDPDFSARKGEERRSRSGTVTQPIGIWTRRARLGSAEDWDLDGAIRGLLADLPNDIAVWRDLGTRYQLDVFCGLFMERGNQGAGVSPATLLALGERGLILDLDVYGPPVCSSETEER
jgi:hypothetical protein